MTAYNGILTLPELVQMLHYEDWGSHKTYPHMSVAMVVGIRYAVQVDQAGGVAFRRHAAGPGDLVARSHQRCRRHPHAVPSRDRHRSDHSRGCGNHGADDGRRHRAKADRRGEHGLHLRQGERRRAIEARHPIFRDGRQSRDLSRRLDRSDDAAGGAVAAGTGKLPDLETGYKWELYNIAKDYSESNDLAAKMPDKLKEMQALFKTVGGQEQVFPLDNSGFSRLLTPRRAQRRARPSSPMSAKTPAFQSATRRASWTATTRSPPTSPSRRRRRRHDRHARRPLRRLRPLSCSMASRSSTTTSSILSRRDEKAA